MKKIFLIGKGPDERFSVENIARIAKTCPKPIIAVSGGVNAYDPLMNYALNNSIDFYDDFLPAETEKERVMRKRLGRDDEKGVEKVKASRRRNIADIAELRREIIDDLFSGHDKGTLVHQCDRDALYWIKEGLESRGYNIKTIMDTIDDIEYKKGSALNTLAQVLAHGVACDDIEDMGTGIAEQMNKRWPDSYSRFKRLRRAQRFRVGDVIIDYDNDPMIAYLATQPDLRHAEMRYVNQSLRRLRKILEKEGIATCAMPKIGCGYGKLEWKEVKPLVEEKLSGSTVKFIVYDNYKR